MAQLAGCRHARPCRAPPNCTNTTEESRPAPGLHTPDRGRLAASGTARAFARRRAQAAAGEGEEEVEGGGGGLGFAPGRTEATQERSVFSLDASTLDGVISVKNLPTYLPIYLPTYLPIYFCN